MDDKYSREQFDLIRQMKGASVYSMKIPDYVAANDIKKIFEYALLGQEYDGVIRHYDVAKNSVQAYLGAVYVGIDEDDAELMAILADIPKDGLMAESKLDEIKQKAGYKYLYGADAKDKSSKELLSLVWKSFNKDDNLENMIRQELQFWWELIPSTDYTNTGSVKEDIMWYLSNKKG